MPRTHAADIVLIFTPEHDGRSLGWDGPALTAWTT